jgi:hypothetical protein
VPYHPKSYALRPVSNEPYPKSGDVTHAHDAEQEQVRVELVLAMDLADIAAGDVGKFQDAVAQDVAQALAGNVSKVRVLSVEAGHQQINHYLSNSTSIVFSVCVVGLGWVIQVYEYLHKHVPST